MFFTKCSKITEAEARLYMRQTALSAAVIQARFLPLRRSDFFFSTGESHSEKERPARQGQHNTCRNRFPL